MFHRKYDKLFNIAWLALLLVLITFFCAQAMNFKQYAVVEGNESSTNQTMAVSTSFPSTRVIFDQNTGATSGVTVYYQLLDRGDWISGGSATHNGTATEANLVVDIDTEGITDLKFVSDQAFNATVFQFETGVTGSQWN